MTGFEQVDDPALPGARPLLPDYRDLTAADWVRHAAWILVLSGLAVAGWHQARVRPDRLPDPDPDPTNRLFPHQPLAHARVSPTREAGPMSRSTTRRTAAATLWPPP